MSDRKEEEEEEAARERPISRRHVLGNVARAGAVGAGAAVLVGVGVEPALAGSDGDVVLGAPNTASAVTRITNASGTAFTGSGSVNGVEGNSSSGIASGVIGQNDSGGLGVVGRAADGIGVSGESTNGTGVLATSFFGRALDVSGAAGFSRSGVKSIAFPNKSATVSVPGGLSSSALALATVQDTTGVYVKSAVPNVGAGTIQINLNKAPGTSTNPRTAKVGWFVVN